MTNNEKKEGKEKVNDKSSELGKVPEISGYIGRESFFQFLYYIPNHCISCYTTCLFEIFVKRGWPVLG
jgi:hypothetical protein